MPNCTEITIYKVSKENIPRVLELSLSVITEMNTDKDVITSYQVMQSVDNDDEICWHLTWVNQAAIKAGSKKWPHLPSSKALMSLVNEKVYYGHFIKVT